jgi:hypothetical protein
MSITHSVILLVTLIFVLTTRGITLDTPSPIRNTPKPDFQSPIVSPQSFAPSPKVRRVSTFDAYRRVREQWDGRPSSRESIQSAPASPAELQGRWNLAPPSALSRFLPDEEVTHSDSEINEMRSFSGTEDIGQEDIADRYPTPVSDGTYE